MDYNGTNSNRKQTGNNIRGRMLGIYTKNVSKHKTTMIIEMQGNR